MGNVHVVVGGFYGSEGKGHVSAQIARANATGPSDAGQDPASPGRPLPTMTEADLETAKRWAAVRVAGPNAGHTAIGLDGNRYALRQIPAVAVTNLHAQLIVGPGSEIEPSVLAGEIEMLDRAGFNVSARLVIDNEATIVEPRHAQAESSLRHGTTGKGIGAARADRLMRGAHRYRDFNDDGMGTAAVLHDWLAAGNHVLVEGTQGYGLGQHAGYYPHCTSSDCRAIDFLAMAGICPWWQAIDEVIPWVVLRTYPIRIAGNSGPLYAETSWAELGRVTGGHVKPEQTTVTHKTRRVGHWDDPLARAAVKANGGKEVLVALTFLDYWYPQVAGATDENALTSAIREHLAIVEERLEAPIALVTTGPSTAIDFRIGKRLGEG